MKKKAALILVAFLAAGVTGCTSNQTQPEQEPDSEVTTEAVEDTESDSEESSSETQEEKTEDMESTEEESTENRVIISYEALPMIEPLRMEPSSYRLLSETNGNGGGK